MNGKNNIFFLDEGSISWYVYDLNTKRYCELDNPVRNLTILSKCSIKFSRMHYYELLLVIENNRQDGRDFNKSLLFLCAKLNSSFDNVA